MSMLKNFIINSGRSQAYWAAAIGIQPSYLSALANGGKTPSLVLAVRIAKLTNGEVPAESWVDDDKSTNSEDAA